MAGALQTESLQRLRTKNEGPDTSQSALIGRLQECCAHTFPVYIQTKGSRDFHHRVQAQTGSVGFRFGLRIQKYDEGGDDMHAVLPADWFELDWWSLRDRRPATAGN